MIYNHMEEQNLKIKHPFFLFELEVEDTYMIATGNPSFCFDALVGVI